MSRNFSKIFINTESINFSEYNDSILIHFASWSPDSKKLALSVEIKEAMSVAWNDLRYNEIWVIDVERYMQENSEFVPKTIINLRKLYCMYSSQTWAEFITDSTLAVSMYKTSDNFSYLYEITTDGRMVRQLTFSP